MNAHKIIIVPTTHWDREWYVPFNEFRAYLVIMMDKLIEILLNDLKFTKFTLDGQIIPIEDYLEVKPENEEVIKKLVIEKRLSIGPFYDLPDEFLVSGESIIRNLLLGYIIGKRYGVVMKAGYIPDTFGHIAQLPQILSGFEISSALFMRGFGNEFEMNNLNMEFLWNAPKNAASVIGVHLIHGYSSAARLNTNLTDGKYNMALKQLKRAINKLEKFTATDVLLLNNGSDHLFAQPEVSDIVKQWNEVNPNKIMEINDFEYYINHIQSNYTKFKSFEGELRAGKYHPILTGVLSSRMWIKQKNTEIEHLYEKYTEPISTITCILDKYNKFNYPKNYIWHGLKWLLKNHPHDSICGCSIDEVHEDMKARFDWAEDIGKEIIKSSFIYLSDLIKIDYSDKNASSIIIYNPLPWKRKDIAYIDIIALKKSELDTQSNHIKLTDNKGKEIEYQIYKIKEKPRYFQEPNATFRLSFIAEIPACGYNVYFLNTKSKSQVFLKNTDSFKLNQNIIENEYYRVEIKSNGQIDLFDKKSKRLFENIIIFEDGGDWGDEYDFSGPKGNRKDKIYFTKDASEINIKPYTDGSSEKGLQIYFIFKLPISLTNDRLKREDKKVDNKIKLYISIYKGINRIDFKIKINNKSRDHRIRAIFNSHLHADRIFADGHFYIVPRGFDEPNCEGWIQKALKTNHQKDFVCIQNNDICFAIFNKGLPEYEAIKNDNGTIKFAITLLRCIGWLSRGDLATRGGIAGPDLRTPEAQCLGKHQFELSLSIINNQGDFLNSGIHLIGKEFNAPLMTIIPTTINTVIRANDKLILSPLGLIQLAMNPHIKEYESYMPENFSFLEITNKNIMLSALKKAEQGDYLIIRLYNLASNSQSTEIKFFEDLSIKDANIVNFLEETPINTIKAEIESINHNFIQIKLDAHVIATIKLKIELKI